MHDVQPRRGVRKRDMAELVAEAAGLCEDEWDLELFSAPLKIFHLLCVRAHAYSMCSVGHLHSWMKYVNRFLFHYTKRPGTAFRLISPTEAEEADKEVMGEVFRMVYHDDVTFEDALDSVVREDLLRHKLLHLPKGPTKTPAAGKRLQDKEKGDRVPLKRRKADPAVKRSKCHAWQKDGKCRFGDECKFAHEDREWLGPGSGDEAAAVSMPLLASDFYADHGTVVAQDAVVCSAASSGSVLATQVQYGTGSQRDARPEANFDQHCCADLAPAKSSSLASFCSIPITDGGGRISTACWVHPQEPVDRLKYLRGKFCIGCGLGVLCPGF